MLNDQNSAKVPPLKVVEESAIELPDTDRTYLDRFLALGVLNVYGFRGEMSRRVRADVAFAGLLIIVQACLDVMAWFLGMKLVFVGGFGPVVGYPLAVIFAFLFASTIAIFERSVLTADLSMRGAIRSPAIWFRMVFVVLASLVTAVPLELFLFNDEISHVVETEQAESINRAQDVLRGNVDGLLGASDAKFDKDLARVEEQYAQLRVYDPPKVTSVTPRLEGLERQITHVSDEMEGEEEGSRSGHSGKGKRYKSLESQLEVLNKQLVLVTAAHNAELADLRKDARSRAEAGEAAYQQAVQGLRADHEKERAHLLQERAAIENIPVPDLAAKAKVNIDVANGFSARTRVLSHLAEKETTIGWGIWAVRLVMVLFGLLVLMQKATFSTETKAYFSASARAAQGDPRMKRLFSALTKLREVSDNDRLALRSAIQEDAEAPLSRLPNPGADEGGEGPSE